MHGEPSPVLLATRDLESLEETIEIRRRRRAAAARLRGRARPRRGSGPRRAGRSHGPTSTAAVTDDQGSSLLAITPTARRQLTGHLTEAVAAAAYEFIVGPLLDNPHRVGKRLRPPLDDRHSARRGTYRVVYRIDDDTHTVTVLDVAHHRSVT